MSEFGELWKHSNNPASTNSVKSLQNVKVGHYTEEEVEEDEEEDDDDDDDDDDEEQEQEQEDGYSRSSPKET